MAKAISQRFRAGFDYARLPGRVSVGSQAYFRKGYTQMARQQMASVIARYNTFIAQLEAAGPEAVEDALRPIFDKSQEYVPVDTGTLAESGVLDVQKQGNGKVLGTIEYGNQAAWYAALVHEMVWLNHTPPTRAKYLQAALEEEMDNIMTSVLLFYSGAFK